MGLSPWIDAINLCFCFFEKQIPDDRDVEDEKYRYDDGEEFFVEKNVLGMVDNIMNKQSKSLSRTPTPTPITSAKPVGKKFKWARIKRLCLNLS